MDIPLTFQYSAKADDYTRALSVYYLRQKWTWALLIVSGLLFLVGLFFLLTSNSQLAGFSIFFVLFFPFYILFFLFRVFAAPGAQPKNKERMTAETTWTVSDDGLNVKTKFAETKMDWGTFYELLESRHYFLMYYAANRRLIQIIPKRAFQSPAQEGQFRALALRHLAGSGKIAPEVPFTINRYVGMAVVFGCMILCIVALTVYNYIR